MSSTTPTITVVRYVRSYLVLSAMSILTSLGCVDQEEPLQQHANVLHVDAIVNVPFFSMYGFLPVWTVTLFSSSNAQKSEKS
eukprot:6015951-Amphidinium_carterae.2